LSKSVLSISQNAKVNAISQTHSKLPPTGGVRSARGNVPSSIEFMQDHQPVQAIFKDRQGENMPE
jgi:hypothetical protein